MQEFIDKQNDLRTDLFRFVAISLLITFFVDITLTKIAQQPLISTLISLIPGSDTIGKFVKTTNNVTSTSTDFVGNFKFGSIKTVIFYFPGIPIGTLIMLILRQLRYRSKKNDKNAYPGGTILLLFLLAVPIVLGFDILAIAQGKAPVWSSYTNSSRNPSSNTKPVTAYGLKQFSDFSQSYLINPVYYVATASVWIFDWYLFSRMWLG